MIKMLLFVEYLFCESVETRDSSDPTGLLKSRNIARLPNDPPKCNLSAKGNQFGLMKTPQSWALLKGCEKMQEKVIQQRAARMLFKFNTFWYYQIPSWMPGPWTALLLLQWSKITNHNDQHLSGAHYALVTWQALSYISLRFVCKVGTTIISPHFLSEKTESKQVALSHKGSKQQNWIWNQSLLTPEPGLYPASTWRMICEVCICKTSLAPSSL